MAIVAQGPRGPIGPSGPRGPKGDRGAQGVQGPAGPRGQRGPAGPSGGPDGAQGPQGPPGERGPSGTGGAQGPAGSAGAQGPQGPAGPQGQQGGAGAQGPAGAAGPQGAAGSGAQGAAGPQGAMGPQGSPGDSSATAPWLSLDMAAGASSATLTHLPANWTKGGSLIIGAGGPTCEYIRVASTNGTTVALTSPSFYAHPAGTPVRWDSDDVIKAADFGLVSGDSSASAGAANSLAHERAMRQAYEHAYHTLEYPSGAFYFSRPFMVWQSMTVRGKIDGTIIFPADDFDFGAPERALIRQYRGTTGIPAAAIASSTNATPVVVTTSVEHGLTTDDLVQVSGHAGNVAANGVWAVEVVDATSFRLRGCAGSGVGTASGTATRYLQPTLYHDFGPTGRIFLRELRLDCRNMEGGKGILASLQQPAEWANIRVNNCQGEYAISISDTQQAVLRNVIIDTYGASGLDLWVALFCWCENLDIENGSGPAIQAAGCQHLSIHNFHNEGTVVSPVVSLFDCEGVSFNGTTWFSLALETGTVFYMDGSPGRTAGATDLVLDDVTFSNSGAWLAVDDRERGRTWLCWDDFHDRVMDFVLGPVRVYPARNTIFRRYGKGTGGLELDCGVNGVTLIATSAGTPILGTSTGSDAGILGTSGTGAGVQGSSTSGYGLYGLANSTKAGVGGESQGAQPGVEARTTSTGPALRAVGSSTGLALDIQGKYQLSETSVVSGDIPATHMVVSNTLLANNPDNHFYLPAAADYGYGRVLEFRCLSSTMPARNCTFHAKPGEQLNGVTDGYVVETHRGIRWQFYAVQGSPDGWWGAPVGTPPTATAP